LSSIIRVLIVEDSKTDAALIVRFLTKQGFEVIAERIETAEAFKVALHEKPWDIIISDYVLPSFGGLEVLEILREGNIDIPCIITSGRIDDETAVAAMRAGARDYVMKDNLKRLGPAVERELKEAEVRRQAAEAEKVKRQTEARLFESQQRLDLAVQAGGGGVFEYLGGSPPSYFFDERMARITGYQLQELPRPDKFIYWLMAQIHPEDLNSVLDVYDKFAAKPRDRFQVEFRLKHRSGHWIYVRCVATGIKTESVEEGVRLNGIILDITDSKQAERRILLTNQIMQLFWEVSSKQEYLEKTVEILHDWCGCECLGIRMLDKENDTIPYLAQVGFSEDFLKSENKLILNKDQCACIRVVAGTPEPQDKIALTAGGSFSLQNSVAFVSNLAPADQARFRAVCVRSGFQTIAVVPVRFNQAVLGAIHITDKNIAALSSQEIETIEAVAAIIGQGVYRFEISDSLKRAEAGLRHLSRRLVEVQEEEKRNIARELHDEIGQSLTALKIMVGQALHRPQGDTLSDAYSLVSDLLKQVREMSLDLRPSMLDDLGLLPALLWQFERFANQTGIKINFSHEGLQTPLPDEFNTTAFRIIQEALTNVVRYAGVSEADVKVINTNGILSILVEDKGKGFSLSELDARSSAGLSGMRERVLLLDGKLDLDSSPGQGTRISVDLPLPRSR
jgi:PAS domain S-box-containing protein